MAGPWYVDDGGDGSDGTTWAKAYQSIQAMDTAKTLASGEIVYIGHDHVDPVTHTGTFTITGPTASPPVLFISATQGSDPPVYQASTTNQIDTAADGAYSIQFSGSFALYGLCMAAGARLNIANGGDESFYAEGCTFKIAHNSDLYVNSTNGGSVLRNCTVDMTADTGSTSQPAIITNAKTELFNITFVDPVNRTDHVISGGNNRTYISGCDFSGFPTTTEVIRYPGIGVVTNCILGSGQNLCGSFNEASGVGFGTNVGTADAPATLMYHQGGGSIYSSTSIYRSGGATAESIAIGWLVTTGAWHSESTPLYSPWLYGTCSSTGAKTFSIYITNDTADFDNSQVWLELEYLATADSPKWSIATDKRATILTTAVTNPNGVSRDDTTSTWVGLNNSGQGLADYMQVLKVPATIGEEGQYRIRVCVGVANIAGSRYFYIDPKVTVT